MPNNYGNTYESSPTIPTGFKVGAVAVVLFIIIILSIALSPIVAIGAGERGVVYNSWNGQLRVLGEGTHFRQPFAESVTEMSVKQQKTEVDAAAATKDLQSVSTKVVVTWHADAGSVDKIYQQIGDMQALVDKIVTPSVNETVKAATAQFTAEETLTKRPELKAKIDAALGQRLAARFLVLDDASIVNIDFSAEFNKAIEAKAQAEQNALAERNKLEAVKYQAEQRVAQASGEAQAIKIQSDALAQNQNLIQLELAKRWDGHLPQYMAGDSVPLINLPK